MNVRIEKEWGEVLAEEFEKPYFKALTERVRAEYGDPNQHIYPAAGRIFAAFDA